MKLQTAKTWLKTDAVKNGETITILDEGQFIESSKYTYPDGTPRKDFVVKVRYNDSEYDMRINATNKKFLVTSYGDETKKWINKVCKMNVVDVLVSGKLLKTILLTPIGEPKDVVFEP